MLSNTLSRSDSSYLQQNSEHILIYLVFSRPELGFSPIESLAEDLGISLETNVIGVSQTINSFLPLLRAGNHKKVISLSSGLGDEEFTRLCGFSPHMPYSVSKYSLNLMILKYALALKEEGFIFLAISPGVVDTFEGPPPPPELILAYANMFDKFKTMYPHFEGPVEPRLAVGQMLEVFKQLKPEHSGNFCSQYGPTSRTWL
ncbi:NAD-P-binding protein [Rhizoctonia solani]|uniref:NAD-P-binding protein n=1 Tax=Rhizoctonia solani TaxID=456999 RepID=A0A8H7IHU1_9AGAM|nr:NAD-P-binding protein [Rhizoctonia solani]